MAEPHGRPLAAAAGAAAAECSPHDCVTPAAAGRTLHAATAHGACAVKLAPAPQDTHAPTSFPACLGPSLVVAALQQSSCPSAIPTPAAAAAPPPPNTADAPAGHPPAVQQLTAVLSTSAAHAAAGRGQLPASWRAPGLSPLLPTSSLTTASPFAAMDLCGLGVASPGGASTPGGTPATSSSQHRLGDRAAGPGAAARAPETSAAGVAAGGVAVREEHCTRATNGSSNGGHTFAADAIMSGAQLASGAHTIPNGAASPAVRGGMVGPPPLLPHPYQQGMAHGPASGAAAASDRQYTTHLQQHNMAPHGAQWMGTTQTLPAAHYSMTGLPPQPLGTALPAAAAWSSHPQLHPYSPVPLQQQQQSQEQQLWQQLQQYWGSTVQQAYSSSSVHSNDTQPGAFGSAIESALGSVPDSSSTQQGFYVGDETGHLGGLYQGTCFHGRAVQQQGQYGHPGAGSTMQQYGGIVQPPQLHAQQQPLLLQQQLQQGGGASGVRHAYVQQQAVLAQHGGNGTPGAAITWPPPYSLPPGYTMDQSSTAVPAQLLQQAGEDGGRGCYHPYQTLSQPPPSQADQYVQYAMAVAGMMQAQGQYGPGSVGGGITGCTWGVGSTVEVQSRRAPHPWAQSAQAQTGAGAGLHSG